MPHCVLPASQQLGRELQIRANIHSARGNPWLSKHAFFGQPNLPTVHPTLKGRPVWGLLKPSLSKTESQSSAHSALPNLEMEGLWHYALMPAASFTHEKMKAEIGEIISIH